MSDDEFREKLKDNRNDYFGSKYSEHVFGSSGGKVSKLEKDTSKEEEMEAFDAKHFWKDVNENENNYMKKQTLTDKTKNVQREKLISSTQLLGDLRPKHFFRNLNLFLEKLTPEEMETLILIKDVILPFNCSII